MTTLISQLTDRRAQVHDAAHNLNERGRTRNLSTAEATEFNSLIADVRMLDDRIAQLRDDQTRNDAAAAAIPTSIRQTNRVDVRGGHWLANEIRALTGSAGSGASVTPSEFANYFFDRLAAQSVVLASGSRTVITDRDNLVVPRLTADAVATFVAEAAALTESTPTLDAITATPRKLSALAQLSNEVIADSVPEVLAMTADSMARSIALRFDLAAIEGTGTAPEIRGLRNVAGIGSVSMGANGLLPTNLDPFADALGTLETANATGSAILMSPRTWQTLSKVKEATGSAKPVLVAGSASPTGRIERSIYGVPVYLSSQMSITETQGTNSDCSSAYVVQADQLVVVLRSLQQSAGGSSGNTSRGLSDVARVELDSSRLFNSDQSELRAVVRADLVVPNPGAVVRIVGIRAI